MNDSETKAIQYMNFTMAMRRLYGNDKRRWPRRVCPDCLAPYKDCIAKGEKCCPSAGGSYE